MKLTRRDLVCGTAAVSVIGLTPIRLFGQLAAAMGKRMESLIDDL
jgi:hypothetical protein